MRISKESQIFILLRIYAVFNILPAHTSESKAYILKFNFHKLIPVVMMRCLRWQWCLPPSLSIWVLFQKPTWWQKRTNSCNCPLTFTLILACNSSFYYLNRYLANLRFVNSLGNSMKDLFTCSDSFQGATHFLMKILILKYKKQCQQFKYINNEMLKYFYLCTIVKNTSFDHCFQVHMIEYIWQ